ncbi:MAG: Asp23/Gls24 family envelope stress response protein [Firmicutes bacterium]|nr:Asp23/Gls24 family envelope stress response protein [Bacillota bacterium]
MASDKFNFHNNKKDTLGKVIYGSNVLKGIIALATKEVYGIVSLSGRGIRLKILDNQLNIDLYVSVVSNIKCSDVAFMVQENVKNNIESVTKYVVREINVNILGVGKYIPKSVSNLEIAKNDEQTE